MIARRFRIHGRVQGVGFRFATCLEARRLRLCGWVRNRGDGSVEVHAEGEPGALAQLATWLAHGPPSATVDTVQASEAHLEHAETFEEQASV
ncbi:acylphosphatase [Chitiniphilus purpureus]|uniref:Acylphosphatase n=1 Tax=Chitiniphilus purpureus TaxID=2981137 RepID=A0ABY6DHV5_9NEIS|nr:acylphosphatase [Chitiniphilus sp. CD1]UXY13930.1 acylphosphatase [Chitiniphilus sp. CD1]